MRRRRDLAVIPGSVSGGPRCRILGGVDDQRSTLRRQQLLLGALERRCGGRQARLRDAIDSRRDGAGAALEEARDVGTDGKTEGSEIA